ncbi:MAG: fimbrillin family protein [Bacteroidales bacterium]|nr:fimbrillin family protein [Bacteroidales bacterium]
MTIYGKYKNIVAAIAMTFMFCGCSDVDEPGGNGSGNGYLHGEIAFVPALSALNGTPSRSEQPDTVRHAQADGKQVIIETEPMPERLESRGASVGAPYGLDRYGSVGMRMSAYVTDPQGNKQKFFGNLPFIRENDGTWRSPENQRYQWPHGGSIELFSWTPPVNFNDYEAYGDKFSITETDNDVLINVTTTHWACESPDICVHHSTIDLNDYHTLDGNDPVLRYRHIMAGIRIKFAPRIDRGNVNRLDINGWPVTKATYSMANDTWTVAADNAETNLWSSEEGNTGDNGRRNFNHVNLTQHVFNDIMRGDQTFMVIPQKLEKDVEIVVFGTDGINVTFKIPAGTEFKAGTMTTLKLAEDGYYVEEYTDSSQSDNIATTWKFNLRMVDDYIFEGSGDISYAVSSNDDNAYVNNHRWRWGHRTNLSIVTKRHNKDVWQFLVAQDLRFDYFIGPAQEEYSFRECDNGMFSTREELFTKKYNDGWYTHAGSLANIVNVEWNGSAAPWQCLGGKMKVRVNFRTRKITFTPIKKADGTPDMIFPDRLPLNGSVHGLAYIELSPDGGESSTNYRSFRDHWMYHPGGSTPGKYTADVAVTQFCPYNEKQNRYDIPNGWQHYGSLIIFESTLHGSRGHKAYHEEYESRLGCRGNISWEGGNHLTAVGSSVTIENVSRMYAPSYFRLPVGWYRVEYDMSTKQLRIERLRALSGNEGKLSRKFSSYTPYLLSAGRFANYNSSTARWE